MTKMFVEQPLALPGSANKGSDKIGAALHKPTQGGAKLVGEL